MKLRNPRIPAIVLVFVLCSSAVFARLMQLWPYDKLVAQSDLVAIIEPLENRPAQDTFPGYSYGHPTNDFAAINTRFKVHAMLKGNGDALKELTVLHFNYSTNLRVIADGALFIRFFPGPLQYEKRSLKDGKPVGGVTTYQEAPIWLAFLKRRGDGRFEPVTGHYDSSYSFREVHSPSFYSYP